MKNGTMRITDNWISSPGLQAVFDMIEEGGHKAYLVGGCVRNALLGQPVADLDISTDAVPTRVEELAAAAGLKSVPTGIDHGTVTVIADGVPHEVTTFRRDVETDGRRAVVAYSDRLEEDANRRDFTMNALYADRSGQIVDPLGGLDDLAARRVRFVGDAQARITEDYLRILRFFRFHAWYGDPAGGLDAEGLAACAANSAGIDTLSRERIGHEMRKLLAAPDPAPAMAAMQATGVLARVAPGADARALAPLVHLEPPYGPDWMRRLVALIGANGPVPDLRLSRSEARQLSLIQGGLASGLSVAEAAYRHGTDRARDIAILRSSLTGNPLPDRIDHDIALGAGARFPVRATDLDGRLSGEALGRHLKALETRWIASGFTLSREQLLA
jgi:poly(A) polymerase